MRRNIDHRSPIENSDYNPEIDAMFFEITKQLRLIPLRTSYRSRITECKYMRLNWRLPFAISALVLVLVHVEARSDAPSFGVIDDNPNPAQSRFLQHSLETLELANAPTLTASAKTNKRIANQSFWIARLDDSSLCDRQRCLTAIVEGRDQSDWHVQILFYAGDIVSLSEPDNKPFGESAFVFSSKGSDQIVIATKTQLGWLIR